MDVIVVGGGMLGMCVAMLAARNSAEVMVCRLSDVAVPHADTLRNQSWLQSGLRYVGATDSAERLRFATRMKAARQLLHDELGFPMPVGFGVFRMKNENDAAELEQNAAHLGVRVWRLDDKDAQQIVGMFYEPDSPYYATPEVPFDETAILDELRARVGVSGEVREIATPVALVPDASPSGFGIRLEDGMRHVTTTVLAAGAGNIPLLAQLGLPASLGIEQTPLLVIPRGDLLPRTRIFVDRVRRFSVVGHPASAEVPGGATVIGVDGHTAAVSFTPPARRKITTQTAVDMWKPLPHALKSFVATSRLTAGFEVKPVGSSSSSLPWISQPYSGYPGLIAAIPGRATLGMAVAESIVARMVAGPARRPIAMQGATWTQPIYMHHDPYYSALNDV